MAGDFHPLGGTLGIDREYRDALFVGGLDGRADREPVTRHEDDGSNAARNEILHLVGLLFDIHVGVDHEGFVAVLFRLGLDVIADNLEKRVGQCERRIGDDALFIRASTSATIVVVGGLFCRGRTADEGERQGGQAKELCDTFHVNLKAKSVARE